MRKLLLALALAGASATHASEMPVPSEKPAQGEIWDIDQIRFPRSSVKDPGKLKELEPDHSMAEVVTTLNKLGIKFERISGTIDTTALPPAIRDQILALPPGEPWIVPGGDTITINVIMSRNAAPAASN